MQRVGTALLIALAVLVLGSAVYVVARNGHTADAGRTSAAPGSPSRATPIRSNPSPPSPTSAEPRTTSTRTSGSSTEPVVAFLGDDWTAGEGASAPAKRFSTILCAELHLRERNLGVKGTGYAKSSTAGDAYGDRVSTVVAAKPQVVVVSGGRNDVDDDAGTAATAIKRLFATLHARLPNAVLIAIAPFWGDSDRPAKLAQLAKAIRTGVTAAGGTYLDLADPIHAHPGYMADDADPNARGHAAIAAAVKPRLAALIHR